MSDLVYASFTALKVAQARLETPDVPAKAVLVFSGGQDSTTCLAWLLHHGWHVHCVTFDYGQKHQRETWAAGCIVKYYCDKPLKGAILTHEIIKLPADVLIGASPLVNKNAKLEQYANHAELPGGIEKTFVPCRNQLFATIAANRAAARSASVVVLGVCEADYGGYPDCRSSFLKDLSSTLNEGTFTGEEGAFPELGIAAPLLNLTKAESIHVMQRIGQLHVLGTTHTGYDGEFPPTGKDHATLLRAKGFEEAGIPDPLVLRAWIEGKMPLPKTPNYSGIAGKK